MNENLDAAAIVKAIVNNYPLAMDQHVFELAKSDATIQAREFSGIGARGPFAPVDLYGTGRLTLHNGDKVWLFKPEVIQGDKIMGYDFEIRRDVVISAGDVASVDLFDTKMK